YSATAVVAGSPLVETRAAAPSSGRVARAVLVETRAARADSTRAPALGRAWVASRTRVALAGRMPPMPMTRGTLHLKLISVSATKSRHSEPVDECLRPGDGPLEAMMIVRGNTPCSTKGLEHEADPHHRR